MYALTNEDYTTINQFLSELHNGYFNDDYGDFRAYVLFLLEQCYGYKVTSFPISEASATNYPHENYMNTISNNISQSVFKLYYDTFFQQDVLRSHKCSDKVVTLSSIMSYEEYEQTDFYQNFMKKINRYYFMMWNLDYNGQNLGSIAVYRSKADGDFSPRDIAIGDCLIAPISAALYNYLEINQLLSMKQDFAHFMNRFPMGVILLDSNYNFIHSNHEAQSICKELGIPDIKYFKGYFSQNILPKINRALSNQVSEKTINISIDNYSFSFTPFEMPENTSIVKYYTLYIFKPFENRNLGKLEKDMNFTRREKEIAKLMLAGYRNEEIAEELFLSIYTVKTHVQNIYKKVNVSGRSEFLRTFTSK